MLVPPYDLRIRTTRVATCGYFLAAGALAYALGPDYAMAAPFISALGGVAGSVGASDILNSLNERLGNPDEILRNGDLTRAVGVAIGAVIGKAAEDVADRADKRRLVALSQTFPKRWETLAAATIPQLTPLSEPELANYFAQRPRDFDTVIALDVDTWKFLLREMPRRGRTGTELQPEALTLVAQRLHTQFPKALREALTLDAKAGGKAFEKILLNILAELRSDTRDLRREVAELLPLLLEKMLRAEAEATREAVRAESKKTREALEAANNQTQPKLDTILQLAESLKPYAPDAPLVNSNLPARNECFTARENELAAIAQAFETRRCVALVGQGGVGKSELALEYAHRNRDLETQPTYRIIAETGAEFAANLADIARLRRFPLPSDAKQPEQLAAVYAWLQTTDDWLLILDNADDPTIIAELLRMSLRGHILLTMQPTPNNRLVHPLPVETLSPQDSARLLLTRAGRLPPDSPLSDAQQHPEYPDALALGAELDGLPLAIDHAAAYIASPPGITVRGYLERYRRPGSKVLRKNFPDALRAHASVYRTVEIVLERIANNPAALDVLYACAFLAPDAIPAFLLQSNAAILGDALKPAAEDEEAWDEAIQGACCYGLLTPDGYAPDGQVFSFAMHRVTQRVLRDMLDEEKRHDRAALVVQALNAVFPSVELNTWPVCRVLTPHAQSCAAHIETEKIQTPEAARLLNQTGYYLDDMALYADAEPLYLQALDIRRTALPEGHPDIATSLNNLAELYQSQGRYADAEPLYLQALDIDRVALGENHPGYATDLNNLAGLYQSQGRYADAEPLYLQALDIRRTAMPDGHPDIAQSLNNLALLYESQGRYADAEPLYLQALDILVVSLGPRHPNTVTVLNNFLTMLVQQGRTEEAGAFLAAKPDLQETFALLLAQQSA